MFTIWVFLRNFFNRAWQENVFKIAGTVNIFWSKTLSAKWFLLTFPSIINLKFVWWLFIKLTISNHFVLGNGKYESRHITTLIIVYWIGPQKVYSFCKGLFRYLVNKFEIPLESPLPIWSNLDSFEWLNIKY